MRKNGTRSLAPVIAVLRRRPRPRALGAVAATMLGAVAACLLAGPHVLLHPATAIVGANPSSDFQIMTWSLAWWPWAVRHGVDPLHTRLLWPPTGFSALWITSIPFPALVGLPLTLLAGPLVAYNVLMLAAVVLATAAAYLLCFELTGRVRPSLLGGAVFGLSPYMLGHTLSQHMNLVFVFPLPLLALLAVRLFRGSTSPGRYLLGTVALLLALAGSSLELYTDLALLLGLSAPVALAFGRSQRRPLLRLATLAGLAYAVSLVVLAPVLLAALSQSTGPLHNSPTDYAVDLANLLVPTATLATGLVHPAQALSAHFVGNIGERDGYVGLPLLVVAALALRSHWRSGAWLAAVVGGLALLLSLGPTVTAGGHPLFSLPASASSLPIVRDALPARMSVFVALVVACLAALWFARGGRVWVRAGAGALVVASLVPSFGAHLVPGAWPLSNRLAWSTRHTPVGFVDAPAWRRLVAPGSTVLVLPTRDLSAAGYWQTEARFRFALAIPGTPFAPPQLAADPTVSRLAANVLGTDDGVAIGAARLRAYLLADRVGAIVATPAASRHMLELARLATGTTPVDLRGSHLFLVSPRLAPLRLTGERAGACAQRAPLLVSYAAAPRPCVRAWLSFDGRRARLHALLRTVSGVATTVLSSARGDAEAPAVAVDRAGRAGIVFTEWRAHRLLLRAGATDRRSRWRVATLDRGTMPIWSARVAVLGDGSVVAAWVDDQGQTQSLRAAVRLPGGRWRETTLATGVGLWKVALAAAGPGAALVAWRNRDAGETDVHAILYARRAWRPGVLLASRLGGVGGVWIAAGMTPSVRWSVWDGSGRRLVLAARLHGLRFRAPSVLPQRARHTWRLVA